MTSQARPASRALRVGVLLRDNLVEERVFTTGAPITIGQSLRCTLSLPVDALPSEHVLFARDDGRFMLRVTRSMQGRLGQVGGAVETLDAIREAAAHDHVWTVPLERGARGKLTIGEATILFQEVAAPIVTPRAQLPAAVRGSLADRFDPRLALIVGLSLATHLGIATFAWLDDIATDSMLSPSIAQNFHQETYEVSYPDPLDRLSPTAQPTAPTAPTTPSQPAVAAPVAPSRQPFAHPRAPVANQIPDAAKLRDDAMRMADLLTNPDSTPGGSPGGMNKRAPNIDLKNQIDAARDKQVTIGNPVRSRPDLKPRIGTVDGPVIDAPDGITNLPDKQPETKLPRILIDPIKHDPSTTLTVDLVLSRINNLYMTGLQRCYAKGLSTDASLAGKVTITFTVDDDGTVDGEARGLTSTVNGCIDSQMAGWRFPVPKTKKGEPTSASFTVALALTR